MNKVVFQQGGHEFNLDNLEFLQASKVEVLSHLVKSDLPTSVDKCVLWGVEVTKNGNNYTHTAGAIYYNNEIFSVDALTTALTDSDIPKFALTVAQEFQTTYKSGDIYNVHHVRKLKLVTSTDVSGAFAYDVVAPKEAILHTKLAPIGSIKHVKMSNVSTHFDLNTGLGKSDWWKGWKIDPDSKGRVIVGYDNNDNDYNCADGTKKDGTKKVVLTEGQLPSHKHEAGTLETDENTHRHPVSTNQDDFDESGGGISWANDGGSYRVTHHTDNEIHKHKVVGKTANTGGGESHENRQPYVVYLTVERIAD